MTAHALTTNRRRSIGRTCRRRGWSLVELLVSTAASAVLIGGLASAVVLATRALPAPSEGAGAPADVALVADQLAADLTFAVSVSELSSRRIAFQVPDRTGDGVPEELTYEWSGAVGAPLRLSRNRSAFVDLLPRVSDFTLMPGTTTVTEQTAPTRQTNSTLLASCLTGSVTSDASIQGTLWTGNVFRPDLPADAVSWRPSAVWLCLAANGMPNGTARVRLYALDWRGVPAGTPLAETTVLESGLTVSYQWYEFAWPGVPELAPGTGVAFIVEHVSNAPSCKVGFRFTPTASERGYNRVVSTDGGQTWNHMSTHSVLFSLYGTVVREVPGGSVDRHYLTTVRVRLAVDGATDRTLETTVRLLNTPEVDG